MTEALRGQAALPALQRAVGTTRVSFRRRGALSVLHGLHQSGCGKVRFPRGAADAPPQAVLINTAGGLTDGDVIDNTVEWQAGAAAIVTTQAAERIYRSRGADARIDTTLTVAPDATAVWLPQETILFDGGRFSRNTEIRLAGSASLIAAESIVFGRTAMGERVERGSVFDSWRLRIDGELVFADGFSVDDTVFGSVQKALDRPAIANGGHAITSLVLVADDVERYLQPLRGALNQCAVAGGASCLGALLTMRLVASDAAALRDTMIRVFNAIQSLTDGENRFAPFSLPRVFDL